MQQQMMNQTQIIQGIQNRHVSNYVDYSQPLNSSGHMIRTQTNSMPTPVDINKINVIGEIGQEEEVNITNTEDSEEGNMVEGSMKEYKSYRDKIKLTFDLLDIVRPQLHILDTVQANDKSLSKTIILPMEQAI